MDTNQPTVLDENSNETLDNEDNIDFRSNRKKSKRHVGPHDNGGLQRTISTGTIIKTNFL